MQVELRGVTGFGFAFPWEFVANVSPSVQRYEETRKVVLPWDRGLDVSKRTRSIISSR